MSVYIQWSKPLLQESWDYTKIERSTTIDGTYTEIASVVITTPYYFDINGTSTNYYKIRFYDSVNLIYGDYSDPMAGTAATNVYTHTDRAITILGTLGAVGPDSSNNYTLFEMIINQNVAASLVEQCYDYCSELVGDARMASTLISDVRPIRNFVSNYASLRILSILAGVSITTHFNYTMGGLNVQKPAVSQIRAMLDHYGWETRRWQKMLLTRYAVKKIEDLQLEVINETEIGSGITYISYDYPNV